MVTKRWKGGGINEVFGINRYMLRDISLQKNRSTTRIYCTTQGTRLRILWSPKMGKNLKHYIYIDIIESLCCTQDRITNCKSTLCRLQKTYLTLKCMVFHFYPNCETRFLNFKTFPGPSSKWILPQSFIHPCYYLWPCWNPTRKLPKWRKRLHVNTQCLLLLKEGPL